MYACVFVCLGLITFLLLFFFYIKSIWNTETKSSQILKLRSYTISIILNGTEIAHISEILVGKDKSLLEIS